MIDVALCPTEIRRFSTLNLEGVTAVVFDVLRATSSIVTGLAHGVTRIIPVSTVEDARARKQDDPSLILAGERGGLPPEGFDIGNSPAEFADLPGRSVVMTTTNGTLAIWSVRHASQVYIGALVNLDALANTLFRTRPKRLLLVCAGTGEEFSFEDAIAAGALIARLPDDAGLSDAAIMARSLYERVGDDMFEWLRQSRNGRALLKIGKGADVIDCSQISRYDTLGVLDRDGVVAA
ncbi:MAG: 2-phosphosulfolactate phosphatase [Verrucomicrobia bacterium]|nr:2-phosphosulfolactate phosphatase [Verrucomicrobiota bacterium]